ncbi:MAG: MDR family oxidoreductase [Rhodococcus sp. (in: high G+C Gram-positive bacteria)]
MPSLTFPAYRVTATRQPAELVELTEADLPDSELLVEVRHSSLNYKDGLAMLGRPGVVRRYPLTCGIDLAGVVVEAAGHFSEGQLVVLTGGGLSETAPGGYSGYQRIDPTHAVAIPGTFGTRGAMAIGTAGVTAMLCVMRLEGAGIRPKDGPVLVTGASGGVGSYAVHLLSTLGYEVHASTGKTQETDYLVALGATDVIGRDELADAGRPLASETWAAAVDSVATTTLATVLSRIRYGGAVAACGLASGIDLPTTVLPFILRGVSLLGVDSVWAPPLIRQQAWSRLEDLVTPKALEQISVDSDFENLPTLSREILAGEIRGRVVVAIGTDGQHGN